MSAKVQLLGLIYNCLYYLIDGWRCSIGIEIVGALLVADFIYLFLKRLGELETGNANTCAVCQSAYNETLAQFHPWLIRKGAVMAMYAMPNRDHLLEKVCLDASTAVKLLPEMLAVARQVYDRTQALYTKYDLHGLP